MALRADVVGELEAGLGGQRGGDPETLELEHPRERVGDRPVVVHDQDRPGRLSRRAGFRPGQSPHHSEGKRHVRQGRAWWPLPRSYTICSADPATIARFSRSCPGILPGGGYVSPILVRPVREQLEHDRVIRLLQVELKRRARRRHQHWRGPDGSGEDRPGPDFPGSGADVDRSGPQADGHRRGRDRGVGQPPRGHGAVGASRPRPGALSPVCPGRLGRHRPAAGDREPASTSPKSGASTPSATRPGSRWCTAASSPQPRRPPRRRGASARGQTRRARKPARRTTKPAARKTVARAARSKPVGTKNGRARTEEEVGPAVPQVQPRQARIREHLRHP